MSPTEDDAPDLPPAPDLAPRSLDDALHPHRTPAGQRRRVIVALLTLAGLVLLTLRLAAPPGGQGTAGGPPPLRFTANVAPALVTLNGAAIQGTFPLTLAPRDGDNTLTVAPPGFAPRICAFTWPGPRLAPGARCTLAPDETLRADFQFADLAPDRQATVMAALDQTFGDATPDQLPLPAGQYYAVGYDAATGAIAARQATTPGLATVAAVPDVARHADDVSAPTPTPAGTVAWALNVYTLLRWRFTDDQGGALGSVALPASETPTPLIVRFTGNRVQVIVANPTGLLPTPCASAADPLNTQLIAAQDGNYEIAPYRDRGDLGCEVAYKLSVNSWPNNFTPDATTPRFLSRFGALLAVNAPAHALLPALPLAPPDEVQAVEG